MGIIYDLSKYAKSNDPDLNFPAPELLHQKSFNPRSCKRKTLSQTEIISTVKKNIA